MQRAIPGLYKSQARFYPDFTGIDSPWRGGPGKPPSCSYVKESVDESLSKIINHVESKLPVTTL
jgi:hypothetical protein